jgi:4a-hydroxytetrahydrobiopterin dehydratase
MNTYTEQSAQEKLASAKSWKFSDNALEKKFEFANFTEAISFMIKVAFICEKKNHHPEWTNVYNRLTIRFNTHDAGGVTDKDFETVKEIDKLQMT